MAYTGTPVITKIAKNVLRIHAPDFVTDDEYLVVDLRTYRMEGAADFTMQVQRTAGGTDVVSVHLKNSNDGTTFTATMTEISHVGWKAVTGKACQQVQIYVSTVGAGNTLDIHVYCTIGG